MGFFQRIGSGIRKAAAAVSGFFGRKPQAPPEPPKPAEAPQITAPPVPEYQSKEIEALRRAMDILIAAETHPDDATYTQARNAALLYINKSQKLVNKGKTQTGNRRTIAEKYIANQLSTPEGIRQRKADKLRVFNSNFKFNLNEEQADIVGDIMETPSFQKLLETYKEMYDVIIGMVGDEIEKNIDPVRVESVINLWYENGLTPDYSDFSKVVALSDKDFQKMQEAIQEYQKENVHDDDIEKAAAVYSIMGEWIKW